jgi:hypothetical protein
LLKQTQDAGNYEDPSFCAPSQLHTHTTRFYRCFSGAAGNQLIDLIDMQKIIDANKIENLQSLLKPHATA